MNELTCCGIDLIGELPEGAIPLEALAIVKYVGEEGSANLAVVISPKLATWEVVGMADHLQRILHRIIAEQGGG